MSISPEPLGSAGDQRSRLCGCEPVTQTAWCPSIPEYQRFGVPSVPSLGIFCISNSLCAVYPPKLVPENLCRPWTRYFPHHGAGIEGSPSLMPRVQPRAWPSCSAGSAVQERSATWTGKGRGRRRRVLCHVPRVGEVLSASLMGPGRNLPRERRGDLS